MKILISGTSKGLGFDLAEYFSSQGHDVIGFARSECPKANFLHIPKIDASKKENLESIHDHIASSDALINNIGMAYDGILATQGYESIARMIDINLLSVVMLTKMYVRARLAQKKSGSVVNISSIISQRGFAGLSVYSATKGALNSLTQSLAREMGPKGFRFNAILPGYFESDLSASLDEAKKSQIIRRTPLGRLATTKDICPLADFLVSEKSKFITGQLISVDGGLTV